MKSKLILSLFFVLFSSAVLNSGEDFSLPWEVGEKLVFSVRWGVIRAGEATLEVREILNLGGREVFRFVHTARSARFFDPFYKVRNRVESFVDTRKLQSIRYERIIREGSYSRDSVIIYDHDYGVAYEDGERFEITEGIQDVLSSFYYMRTKKLEPGEVYRFDIGSSKKIWPLKINVKRREKIKVPAGRFDTVVVEPELMEEEGIFKHEGKIEIWLTDDERKIPVLIRSSIKIGTVSVVLTEKKLPGRR
ncbi:MAG: DUF3108 domain-containing protein [Elusimicrobiota bacterium]